MQDVQEQHKNAGLRLIGRYAIYLQVVKECAGPRYKCRMTSSQQVRSEVENI